MKASHVNMRILMAAMAAILSLPLFAIAQISWVKSFDAAVKQAAKEKKFIVLDVSASW